MFDLLLVLLLSPPLPVFGISRGGEATLSISHKASSRTERIQAHRGQTTPEWMGVLPAHSSLLVAVASPSWETAVGPEEKGRLHSSQGAVDLDSTSGSYAGSGR